MTMFNSFLYVYQMVSSINPIKITNFSPIKIPWKIIIFNG